MLNIKECRGDIQAPVRYDDFSLRDVANALIKKLSDANIPAIVKIDQVKSGGLFGKTYNCLLITHPNPPKSYFQHMYILDNNIVTFKFYGVSKATYNKNHKSALANDGTISGMIRSAFVNDDEMAYNQEYSWHASVIETFNSLFEKHMI